MTLFDYGWNSEREASVVSHRARGLAPARVTRADRDRFVLVTEFVPCEGQVAGAFRHRASRPSEFPAVGDWVLIEPTDGGGVTRVHELLPRAGVLSRRAPGELEEEQVMAANVDVVLLVAGLDGDFNPRRIERFLAAVWEGGAQPVVVLNKADAHPEPQRAADEVSAVAPGVPVVTLSALAGDGLGALDRWLEPGRTLALLGSSGVGKSTLANRLLETAQFATGAVRETDSRGRHTTSHRELVRLASGALLVDGPGIREMQLWDAGSGVASTFEDIEALAARCRFGDCGHAQEPGCAVRSALASGALAQERYASWLKLAREQRAFAARHDARARLELKRKSRSITKSLRGRPDKRRSD
ncbi:MAG: ribosome small subunit-dependent GTPase A [Candidatus Eisenbacteria bacterium]|uniref:Small ribosomal subunit biogenesis GTPase RsgA n=1 Tax=Eiseniibacteriota bacterium TaxID=2212470 RepID=A0A849T295_UNCEI|nr:ribosome small subunit-dependent GTPase A [Candidatus Eisenbacteria bacterium]